ncbi:MAG: TlpA family protein disulfide reductase [Asticcacaulis sp.]|nr:TlpA family protein disulfide reductase [Asticcacaulis sp.]
MDNPLDSDDIKAAKPAPAPEPVADTPIAEDGREPKWKDTGKAKKKRGRAWLIVGGVAVVVLAIAAFAAWKFMPGLADKPFASVESSVKTPPEGPLAPYVKGSIAQMVTLARPAPIENMAFLDRDKKTIHLSDFKGQVVVLNLWATWCQPCRIEMPTLATLQRNYAGKGLKVVALSGDTEDRFDDVKSFIDVQEPLDVYVDSGMIEKAARLNVTNFPSTLILDKQGRVVARLVGNASWDTPEVKALMDKLIAE